MSARRELRARRANLAKARQAPHDLIYRPTPKRIAACLKNLRKAVVARRRAEGNARVRLNALRHGLYSRELIDQSIRRLGEGEREFAEHRELFLRLLVPQNETEAGIVWELSNLAWRRLRLFRAAAEREGRDLRRLLAEYPEPCPLSARETERRMWALLATLDTCDRVIAEASKLRPSKFGKSGYVENADSIASLQSIHIHGMEPVQLAGFIKDGIENNQLYIIPYPESKEMLKKHFDVIVDSVLPMEADPEGARKRTEALMNWAQDRARVFNKEQGKG